MHLLFDNAPQPALSERTIFAAVEGGDADRLIVGALREAGIQNPCTVFSDGPALIEGLMTVLKGAPPPVMCFLDLQLTGMSGLDVLRWIRLQDALAEVPVTILTSSWDPEHLRAARRFGAQCYAEKFPPAEDLRQILREAEQFSAVASGHSAFRLPCNLLLTPQQPAA